MNTRNDQDRSSPPQWSHPPMITLPPRSSLDIVSIGLSPGPMTLVSNFFNDHYPDTDLRSFSQLLTEALPIPVAQNPPPLLCHDSFLNCQKQSEEDDEHNQMDSYSQPNDPKLETNVSITKPANDGYKWRKYGQKQVKASELPRSYYKCTQTNCPATKKIGHFLDGDISDIIYKGQHNHEPPGLHKQAEYGATMHQHTSFVENTKDGKQHADHVVVGDAFNIKKRTMGLRCVNQGSSSRVRIAEPKVVLQTRSEVDILDDGFKWRKYGQKVVKGNTHPRCYYRCAYAGCKVRKHVERVYLDPKSVVTTYEGKHKHNIPMLARPSSHHETNFKTERTALLQLKEEQILS
ncbi:hypothetical protein QVD17_18641 [Tagetes erecta]|uniref:WRKY domain-containing protein n=1 Tax=Tagetes erecta TaxID=13708 RepID=A0AAD8KN80_TARER|nr:hypothetical protein QVD17_18641 [Tagetes erecta]